MRALVMPGLIPAQADAAHPALVNYWVDDNMVDGYCKVHGNKGFALSNPDHPDAHSYRCVAPDGRLLGVSMDAVCRENNRPYRNVAAYFPPHNFSLGAANNWRCVILDSLRSRGGADLKWSCQHFNLGDKLVLAGKTVDDWQCVRPDPSIPPNAIEVFDACLQQYAPNTSVEGAIPRFNYYNPYSVRCYV